MRNFRCGLGILQPADEIARIRTLRTRCGKSQGESARVNLVPAGSSSLFSLSPRGSRVDAAAACRYRCMQLQLAAGCRGAIARSHFLRRPWHGIADEGEKLLVVVTTADQIKPVLAEEHRPFTTLTMAWTSGRKNMVVLRWVSNFSRDWLYGRATANGLGETTAISLPLHPSLSTLRLTAEAIISVATGHFAIDRATRRRAKSAGIDRLC